MTDPYFIDDSELDEDIYGAVRTLGGPGSGNFGHAGRPGEVGGSASSATSDTNYDAIRTRLKAIVPDVFMSDHPAAVRAAEVTASVLEEMHAKGYIMPDSVQVLPTYQKDVSGAVHYTKEEKNVTTRELRVNIPGSLPADANLDDAAWLAFGGTTDGKERFAVRNMRDVIIHEMGHIQAGHRGPWTDFDAVKSHLEPGFKIEPAMKGISLYAAKNVDEFLAETFTRRYRNERIPKDSLKLYRALNGPEIKFKS